jgi:hypothetical protein
LEGRGRDLMVGGGGGEGVRVVAASNKNILNKNISGQVSG